MDKTQAEAVAQAILEPDLRVQQDIRRRRAAEARFLARKRQVAGFVLAGCVIGGLTAHFIGARFTHGLLWGGMAGSLSGWLIAGRRHRPRTTT